MVYARELGDKTYTFIVSGKLWRNSLIMQDKETESLWSHVTGEALEGAMNGKTLDYIPSVQTRWSDWRKEHPETKVLRKENEVKSSAYEEYFKDPERTGIFRTRWLIEQMPGKSVVHGITRGVHALAISDDKLAAGEPLNLEIGDDTLVAFRSSDGGIRSYLANAGGKSLHFHRAEDTPGIKDKETGSTWNLDSGLCTAGPLKGKELEEMVVRTAYWFAWSNFFPNTKVAK